MHLANASDFITRGIDGEDEDEDDRKEHSSVGTVVHKKVRLFFAVISGKNGTVLVTEEGSSHTTDDDVDGHTDRD